MDIQINVKGTKDDVRPSDSHIVDRCANVLRQHGYKVEISWADTQTQPTSRLRTLITTVLLLLTVTCMGQYRAPYYPKSHYAGAKAGAVVLVSTFIVVESMKIPDDYYFTPRFNTRVRQKATVALTGMITTTATVLVVDAVKRKKHRNRVSRMYGGK